MSYSVFERQPSRDVCDFRRSVAINSGAHWRRPLIGAVTGCVLAGLVLWPTAFDMVAIWVNNGSYRYAWLVAPMFVYLLGWHYREEIVANCPKPAAIGVAVTVIAAVFWGAAAAMNIDLGRQIALILAAQGIALSTLGKRLYWKLFPIMGLLFFTIPSGDLLQTPLRYLTVEAIEMFAAITGLPFREDGFSIQVGDHGYVILEACAGLSHLTLASFLGYCFGLLIYRSIYKIVSLAFFGAVLGFLSNVIRVNAIVWADWVNGSQMNGAAHIKVQWVALAVVLVLFFWVFSRLRRDNANTLRPEVVSPRCVDTFCVYTPIIAGLAALAIIAAAMMLLKDAPRNPRAESATRLPKKILDWELATPDAAWSSDIRGGFESLVVTYRRQGQPVRVTIIEPLSPGGKLWGSLLAPQEGTDAWWEVQTKKLRDCAAEKCLDFVHAIWKQNRQQIVQHVYYSYSIGDFATDSRFVFRALNGWFRLKRSRHTSLLIGFTIEGEAQQLELTVAQQAIEAALIRKD